MLRLLVAALALHISLADEICSQPCGCFSDDPPFNDRPLPDTHTDQQLRFQLYTSSSPESPVDISWDNIPPQFSSSRTTIYLIHGWNSSPNTFLGVRRAFFNTGHDYNIITVDWSTGAGNLFYPQSASNTRVIGACTAHLASALQGAGNAWSRQHCIGHSLGAQTCGYMGSATGGALGRISGLDPAGLLFHTSNREVRVDSSDAGFVDLLHTDRGILGSGRDDGDVDFYPNKGFQNPGCGGSPCDHSICKDFYEYSISSGMSCRAYPCYSDEDADGDRCNTCSGRGCSRMGYYANAESARGTFYQRTSAGPPYCLE